MRVSLLIDFYGAVCIMMPFYDGWQMAITCTTVNSISGDARPKMANFMTGDVQLSADFVVLHKPRIWWNFWGIVA